MSDSVWRINLFLYPHEDTLQPKPRASLVESVVRNQAVNAGDTGSTPDLGSNQEQGACLQILCRPEEQ